MKARRAALALVIAILGAVCALPACAAESPAALRVAFRVAESGFDPQAGSDAYTLDLCRAIFDPLYTYDYFARPVRLVPNTAAALPELSDGGRTYTIRVRPGIYFADDPVFGGKKRELVAADYVYSIKRILDPKVRAYWIYVFEKRLVGLDPVLERARKSAIFDYDAPIEGLQALDRHTLRIRFRDPEFGFQHWLASVSLAAVAREVIEKYGDETHRAMEHPVGTGPYRVAEWRRSQRIVLEANPGFREIRYPVPGAGSAPGDTALAKPLAGRRLPLTKRIEVSIIEEAQPQLLAFKSGELDYIELPASVANNVLDGAALKPEFVARGTRLHRYIEPSLGFTFFNLDDPVVGGYTPEKIALRRAIAMAYDEETAARVLADGQAIPATQLVPPPVPGHDPARARPTRFDLPAARALLDRFGYRDRDGDGYRELPDGKPLVIVKGSTPDAAARQSDELWKKNLDAIGIKVNFLKQKWPELNRMTEAGQMQMWNLAWLSPAPDADNFYSPLYEPNIGLSNDARLRLPEYNRAYEQSRRLRDGPERTALLRKLDQLVDAYVPWILGMYSYASVLAQPWLAGYKSNPFQRNQWMYYSISPH